MKHYIMLSLITGSGGVQCYVAAKAKYLEKLGWHVVVISDNDPLLKTKCQIDYLNKYLANGNPYQGVHACFLPQFIVKKSLKRYLNVIGPIDNDDDVIVESWNSPTALWGELIAARLHGRHMFWAANEHFRKYAERDDQCYEEKIAFYMFKMDRGEILTDIKGANRLFVDYRVYEKGDFLENIITEDPIQDIKNQQIDSIVKSDWNICYIGRSNKPYVPYIFKDVNEFAKSHPEKNIQFIIVGQVTDNRDCLESLSTANLNIIELGNLYPLPRALYSKIDVVIAGSGSARHSMDEGAIVITADSWTANSHGILGYDTIESIYREEGSEILDISFKEALERALVKKTWQKQVNKWVKSPGIEECTQRQFEIIKNADPRLTYYDEKELLKGKLDYYLIIARLCVIIRNKIKYLFYNS